MGLARRRSDLARMKAKAANHLKVCSCPGCGNYRRHWGVTMQERRAEEAARAE